MSNEDGIVGSIRELADYLEGLAESGARDAHAGDLWKAAAEARRIEWMVRKIVWDAGGLAAAVRLYVSRECWPEAMVRLDDFMRQRTAEGEDPGRDILPDRLISKIVPRLNRVTEAQGKQEAKKDRP